MTYNWNDASNGQSRMTCRQRVQHLGLAVTDDDLRAMYGCVAFGFVAEGT